MGEREQLVRVATPDSTERVVAVPVRCRSVMTVPEPGTDEISPRPGRPFDAAREAAIRDATLECLSEVGYDALTVEMVAARARAGKGAIYRRWSSKLELVVDAVNDLPVTAAMSASENLVADLLEWASSPPDDRAARVFTGLFTAAMRDPELAHALRRRVRADRESQLHGALERARSRGEIGADADLDLVLDVLPALTLFRRVVHDDDDPDVRLRIVRSIVLPALGVAQVARRTKEEA
jgi:AcrR family transcriptional regulator